MRPFADDTYHVHEFDEDIDLDYRLVTKEVSFVDDQHGAGLGLVDPLQDHRQSSDNISTPAYSEC
jgi:hypothetical protein